MDHFETARNLLREFKGDSYRFGPHLLKEVGAVAAGLAPRPRRAALVYTPFPGVEGYLETIRTSVAQAGIPLVAQIEGAAPNAPREDLLRITRALEQAEPDVVLSFGGGSTIDAVKAALVLRTLGGQIDDYFGTGLVTKKLQSSTTHHSTISTTRCVIRTLPPHIAIQTAASSGAHLTKYSNITDVTSGQKKLIVDEAIVPSHPVFDYAVTRSAPAALTTDGALDGLAHILEVFYGAIAKPYYDKLRQIAETGIALIVTYLPQVLQSERAATEEGKKVRTSEGRSAFSPSDPPTFSPSSPPAFSSSNERAREALCLATDLGGYAIMLGGTNGGHLTSFSLVDILSHGRACALMNPYYTVFFAPAVEGPLRTVGGIFRQAGYITQDLANLHGRDLGLAVAQGMFAFARAIDFPTTLGEVKGFTQSHIERALAAAKDPQLKMKLENMPIPLTAAMIDEYMAPILQAAATGDPSLIQNVP